MLEETAWIGDRPMDTWRLENSALKDFLVATDHLNTPRELIDWMSKAVVWRWDSEPYGVGLPTTAPDNNGLTVTCNLRFPGQVYDAETGLHYNYMRDYNPAIGRYVESDPLGLRAGVNTYAYVKGNPIEWIDKFGLSSEDDPGRYQTCHDTCHGTASMWICKKIVDWDCKNAPMLCCDTDYKACIKNAQEGDPIDEYRRLAPAMRSTPHVC